MPTVNRLVRIQKIVRVEMIGKPIFYNTFDYLTSPLPLTPYTMVRDWMVIRTLLIV